MEPRYTPPFGAREPSLFAKLAAIQGSIGALEPDAELEITGAGARKYKFISESKLLSEIRPLLSINKVAAFVSTDSAKTELIGVTKRDGKPGTVQLSEITTSITFADGESGETFTIYGQGAATDYGDKSVYKAITSACRYMWWKTMLVGTDGDDAAGQENDYTLDRSATASVAAIPTPPAQPAAAQQPAQPKRPTTAAKNLTRNLLEQLAAMDTTRDWEAIIDDWVIKTFGGRGRSELTAAETDSVNRKLETTRDDLEKKGLAPGAIGGDPADVDHTLEEQDLDSTGDAALTPEAQAEVKAAFAEETSPKEEQTA
jgi:hypothetical protein